MTAAEIISALGGRHGVCRCPAHNDRTPSLSVKDADDGRILIYCHGGCSQEAVIAALQDRGLWPEATPAAHLSRRANATSRSLTSARGDNSDDARRTECALSIWRASKPADARSFASAYLTGRGITIPAPPTIRSHAALKHAPTGQHFPAMVCAVQAPSRHVVAVHRTFLTGDGTHKAKVTTPKMALGAIAGGAARLGHAGETLTLTEGIEDALALMQMTGAVAWAVLGTSNFKNFAPPPETKTIILAPDADPAGDAVVAEAAARFSGMGLRTMRLRPPDGSDWCDVLDDFEERAAIMQFDGQRADADLAAFAEIVGGEIQDAAA